MRPTTPLPFKPAGYLQLESYSSLRRFWSFLDAAERAGRRLSIVRGDQDATCRRRIEGFALKGAGALVDTDKALREVEDGPIPGVELLALTAGDPRPLQEMLSERYELQVTVTLGFTKSRDLIARPDFTFKSIGPDEVGVRFGPRRFSRDELRHLLHRACALV